MEDPGHNDFDGLVKSLLETGQSFNIEGRAGTGKSYLIKTLIKQLENKNMNFAALAPTNKAARVIDGTTIHKFKAAFNLKNFKGQQCKYIFIDEISMVQEVFYKFFLYLKRAMPEIKFIIVGDFN